VLVKEARNVLHHEEVGAEFGDVVEEPLNERIPFVVFISLADLTESLARGTAHDAGNFVSINASQLGNFIGGELCQVLVLDRDVRKIRIVARREVLVFIDAQGNVKARPDCPESKSAGTRKEIDNLSCRHVYLELRIGAEWSPQCFSAKPK
jgi:hypothetical protein